MQSSTSHKPDHVVPANFLAVSELLPALCVDLKYFGKDNFMAAPAPGYARHSLMLTYEAARALQQVQQELAYGGLGLKVFDGYRPQRAVDAFIRWAHDTADLRTKAAYYPNLDKARIFADGYLLARSSHSRGSTVDLTVIDLTTGEELDMGTPFDFFDLRSWSDSFEVTMQQRANRMLLRSVMQRQGFVGVAEEWWHFTLRDEPYPDTYFDFPLR